MPMTWNLNELFRSRSRKRRQRRRVTAVVPTTEVLESRALPTGTASGEIAGVAFIDVNDNGVRDQIDANRNGTIETNETTLELVARGITVRLTGKTTQQVDVTATSTTKVDGTYVFLNVLPGTYHVSAEPTDNLIGDSATTMDFEVVGGQKVEGKNLGLGGLRPGSISLRVFQSTKVLADAFNDLSFEAAGTGQAPATDRENNLPKLAANADAEFELGKNESSSIVDLAGVFTDQDLSKSLVRFETSQGDINVELFDVDAPQTVANFFNYVDDNPRTNTDAGRYDGSIFHRLSRNFVLQGGNRSFAENNGVGSFVNITKDPAIENEFGASNTRGTLAMARVGGIVDSASSEFFFNIGNNTGLDNVDEGFTVFGRIRDDAGLAVLDGINAVEDILPQLGAQDGIPRVGYTGTDFPADATSEDFITINDVEIVRRDEFLTYQLINGNGEAVNTLATGLVVASITNNRLTLTHATGTTGMTGSAQLTIRATDRYGATFDSTFTVNVVNHAPEATVTLSPSAPVADATLTATATKSDEDGDTVSLDYVWTINDEEVQRTEDSTSLTNTLVLNTLATPPLPGDTVLVTVTPNDGTVDGTERTATTRINRAPTVDSIQLSSTSPTTNTMLTTTVTTSDADNDAVKLTYKWSVGTNIVQTTSNTTSRIDTLDLSDMDNGNVGDVITVEVTPNDGKVDGVAATASATVANSAPVVSSVSLTPEVPTTADTLLATAVVADDDNNSITLKFVWTRSDNSEILREFTAEAGVPTDSLDLTGFSLSPEIEIVVTVTPNDGTVDGTSVPSSKILS